MIEININYRSYDIARLKTDNHSYELFPTSCGFAFGLFCDHALITEFPRENRERITDYILDLAYTVIVKHEELRERIAFEGIPDFMKQTDSPEVTNPVLISAENII